MRLDWMRGRVVAARNGEGFFEMPDALAGEVLEDAAEMSGAHDVTPGWIGRNRRAIERGRGLARALVLVAPPPARLALGVLSIAADAILLADEMGRRLEDRPRGSLRAVGLVLEGAAVLAASRLAPARLATGLAGIEMARKMLSRATAR